jgi:hypothetical protein
MELNPLICNDMGTLFLQLSTKGFGYLIAGEAGSPCCAFVILIDLLVLMEWLFDLFCTLYTSEIRLLFVI